MGLKLGAPSGFARVYAPQSYGAVGNGVADDTAAIQAAVSAAAAAGNGVVWIPQGRYRITSTVTIANGIIVHGAGQAATYIEAPHAIDAFTISGVSATGAQITDLRLVCTTTTPTSGSGIKVTGNPVLVNFQRLRISGFYDGIDHESGIETTFDNIYFVDSFRYGIRQRNIVTPDGGDHKYSNLIFDTSKGAAAAIRIESSGGAKLSNVKIIRHGYAVDLQVADGVATSVLTIAGCSFESPTTACIRLGRSGTTGTYSDIAITGNQLNGGTVGAILLHNAGATHVSFTGNTLKGSAGNTAITMTGTEKLLVATNTFLTWAKAIVIGTGNGRYTIGENEYGDVATPIEDNTAHNQPNPGKVTRQHRRLISTTSEATYTNLWRVELGNYRGASIDLTIEGLAGGVGNFTRHVGKLLNKGTGNVTVTAVNDVAAGAAIDVQFDTTTTAGSVLIGVKRAAGVGTQIDGSVTLNVRGGVKSVVSL